MPDYRVIVVGTDGSETSLRAVDKAASMAAQAQATLIVASAYTPTHRDRGGPDPDQPHNETYRSSGDAPTHALVRQAADRARAHGAVKVIERAVTGAPADALVALAEEVHADLLVVGDVGIHSMVGRLLGSVPQLIKRRASTEVLIVDTSS